MSSSSPLICLAQTGCSTHMYHSRRQNFCCHSQDRVCGTVYQIISYAQFRQHLKTHLLEIAAHCDSWLFCAVQILLLTYVHQEQEEEITTLTLTLTVWSKPSIWFSSSNRILCTSRSAVINHAHTHPFNSPFSKTTQVSQYQKGKTNLDFTEARHSEWQWHQLGHMQDCTSVQTDNHASTPPLSFLHAGCPSCRPTNSVKALNAVAINHTVNRILWTSWSVVINHTVTHTAQTSHYKVTLIIKICNRILLPSGEIR